MSVSAEQNVKTLMSQIQKTHQALQVIKDSMRPLETQLQTYEQQLHNAQKQIEVATSPLKLKEFLKLQPKISQWLDSQKVDFKPPNTRAETISTTLIINDLQIRAEVDDDGGYHAKEYRVDVYFKGQYKSRIPARWLHCIVNEDNPKSINRMLERYLYLDPQNVPISQSPKSDHHEMMDHWEPTYLIAYWFLSAVMSLESEF